MLDDILCSSPCLGSGVGACGDYSLAASQNCYNSHGADDIDSDTSCGEMSVSDCQDICDDTDSCTGVVVAPTSGGLVNCYRKSNIDLGSCDWDPQFDTWVRN